MGWLVGGGLFSLRPLFFIADSKQRLMPLAFVFGCSCCCTTLCCSCDLPLLADVVPTKMRGFAYSLVDMVQCFFAFLATIIVGLLSEKSFGFGTFRDSSVDTIHVCLRLFLFVRF